ncbi:hypothetical protein [Nocardia cyriacigeorgica]|uniref:hypothetical protein n=1 Tax=Nocardia cyriacigeorgica TaxID=135487 RepID=UPI002457BD54|nr:hypothetical protein [Nocardia cyriacigeorgica]
MNTVRVLSVAAVVVGVVLLFVASQQGGKKCVRRGYSGLCDQWHDPTTLPMYAAFAFFAVAVLGFVVSTVIRRSVAEASQH